VGGVILLSGISPDPKLDYLRYRARDRLSLGLVSGENDPARREVADAVAPFWKELNVRSRLWLVPRAGHVMPPGATLAEVYAWLEEDLPRRRAELKQRPALAASADDTATDRQQAERLVE